MLDVVVKIRMFLLYGSCEALDSVKTLSRDALTISTPAKPHSDNFVVLDFSNLTSQATATYVFSHI